MDAISYSEARAKLASVMDKVCEAREPMLITRQGHPTVVMISLDDYEQLDETAYLMRSPENAKRLLAAIERSRRGQYAVTMNVEDLVP